LSQRTRESLAPGRLPISPLCCPPSSLRSILCHRAAAGELRYSNPSCSFDHGKRRGSAGVLLLGAHLAGRAESIFPGRSARLALVCQLTGYFCLTYALGHLPATVTSLILLAVAPLTAVFAFLIFRERMTIIQLFGGGLVLFGVWTITRADWDRVPRSCAE